MPKTVAHSHFEKELTKMMKITRVAANRLDVELSGALDAQAMSDGLDELLAQSEGMSSGGMLYTIHDFEMPTMGALSVELQYLPKLFGLLGKFGRCAVVSDVSWIRTIGEIEGALIPGLEIKAFTNSSKNAAEAWLGEAEDAGSDEGENYPV